MTERTLPMTASVMRGAYSLTLIIGIGIMVGLAKLLLAMGAAPPLAIELVPHACFAPCTVRIRVQVDPQPDNRLVRVTVEGPRYSSSSDLTLAGEDAPKTQPYFWFKQLPAGEYEVVVTLHSSERMITRTTTTMVVN